jgi:hypothetical protein
MDRTREIKPAIRYSTAFKLQLVNEVERQGVTVESSSSRAHQDECAGHFKRDIPAALAAHGPFEEVALVLVNQRNNLRRSFAARRAVGLGPGGEIFRSSLQQLGLVFGSNEFDRCLIAIQERAGLRIEQPDRINAALEKALEHAPSASGSSGALVLSSHTWIVDGEFI